MSERIAPGLTADWLNGWLAALGATVLADGLTLRWSDDRRPCAVLASASGDDIVDAVVRSWPNRTALDGLLIANDRGQFPRTVTLPHFTQAATRNRGDHHDFSLSSSVTDLIADDDGGLRHGMFDTSAPKGLTLWNRLVACVDEVERSAIGLGDRLRATLDGRGARVATNGLGFDVRRIEAGDPPIAGKYVDPAVEILAFYGLAFFPVRGDGVRDATRGAHRVVVTPAGGLGSKRGRWVTRFTWPAWSQPLDRWALDALLAAYFADVARVPRRQRGDRAALGISRAFEAVSFRKVADMDMTAGYASRRFDG